MINSKVLLTALVGFCFFCFSSNVHANETQPATAAPADSQTSQNLIDNGNWDGATYGNDPGGCCASVSGSGALYDKNTDTIMFSYGRDVLAQTIAINEALKLSGVEVDGFNYGWTWRTISNSGRGGDTLQFEVTVKDAAGNEVERYVYDYSSSLHGMDVWHTESGTETFAQSYLDPQSIALSIIGQDGGFWAGYYGPEVKDVHLSLNYSANPCATNPMYDPSCKGYAEAYAQYEYEQQCQANPLYDIGCAGYEQAYFNQQCSFDPLYSSGCPGYNQAYYDQQCSIDALYDMGCKGYETAYFDQQCSIDPFYDTSCSGYAAAYLDQQCSLNQLYDASCPLYAEAYYEQQCSIDALYDAGCSGYEQAYYEQFIKPSLDEQIAEASGQSEESTESSSAPIVAQDPVATLTQPQITGDVIVDQLLRGVTGNVQPTSPVEIVTVAPEISESVSPTQERESQEAISEADQMVASLEGQLNESESSGDVEESVDSGGDDSESGSEQQETDRAEVDSEGGSESRESSGATAEEKRESRQNKIREIAKQRAMSLANDMANAATLDAQKAVQETILALINFNPDFAKYANGVPDGGEIYGGDIPDSTIPENGRGLLNGLASQILHDKMVESQYQ